MIDVEIKDSEYEHFPNDIKEYLTFENAEPQVISGEVGLYEGKLYIVMNNGDSINYSYYSPYPGDTRLPQYDMQINKRDLITLNAYGEDLEDHPGEFLRKIYNEYLKL